MPPEISKVQVVLRGPTGPINRLGRYGSSGPVISAGVLTIDFSAASTFVVDLDQSVTAVHFTGFPAADQAQRVMAYFRQDGAGNRSLSGWPANMRWPHGIEPQLTATPGAVDAFVFDTFDQGATIFATRAAPDYR